MTRFETLSPDWLTVRGALDRILRHAEPLPTEAAPLALAAGRALAEPLKATLTLPPWDNSAMDGYALRREDIAGAAPEKPAILKVIGNRPAGLSGSRAERDAEVIPKTAIRIMTGAAVPAGADAVVRVEDTDAEAVPGIVRVFSIRDRKRNIRPGGEDMREGDLLLDVGERIGSGQVAVAAALGRTELRVHRRPRVAVLSTGDELVSAEEFEEARRGRAIPETNGPMLAAAAHRCGAVPKVLGIAKDTPESIRSHLERAANSDVLLTTGGASMGEADLMKRVLAESGYALDFWRVRLRPGSPFSLGFLPFEGRDRPLPVFGLPGNPSSAFVTFEILVRPFLLRLLGHRNPHRPRTRARAAERLVGTAGLANYLRVALRRRGGALHARLTGPQGSGLVSGLGQAHGLAVLGRAVEKIEVGEPVEVVLLDGEGGWIEEPPC